MKITNLHNISLPLAVWLLYDNYDYNDNPNYISATTLLKSVKQIVLGKRIPHDSGTVDIADFLNSSFGTAVHDSIEQAWNHGAQSALKRLGYPDRISSNIRINPSDNDTNQFPETVPVYMEKRSTRELGDYLIGGKFDFVIDGRLFDFKTTSVYTYLKGNKDRDYALQGSIYRWLNPDIIKDDYIYINFLFTDWQRMQAESDPKYPKVRALEYPVPLLSLRETEAYIQQKLDLLSRSWNLPEDQLPACDDKELWRAEPVFKYYGDPLKTDGRATKNFDNLNDANAFMASKGHKGIIKTVLGTPRACEYCQAFAVCRQKDQYHAA